MSSDDKVSVLAPLGNGLDKLIAASPIASVISNPRLPDNPIIACNRAFCELTGYDAGYVIGRNCRFLSGPGTEPWLSETIRRGVEEHRPVLVEILNYKKDGTPFRNAVLVAPIYDDRDSLLYFLGSQVEIPDDSPGPSSTRRIRAAELVKGLSERQRQVLKLAADGLLNKQIAGVLGVSEKTVKMHRAILMERLGTPTSADMVRVAVEAGL
ncbi:MULTISPECIES: PAS domain-containing protein [unclassified Sphingomonas]|jgi:PAS domain S-box-containing protein|uniref:PAS domain-containing protein n=1 Tax=unclassified Sphingomonas TaxID=196159 RepID=UPI000AD8CA0F|nr:MULTISPECIES: LuxR C-terminal-related transcriptional regulator [unclassified Sphingomonas]